VRNPREVVLGLIFLSLAAATFFLMADFPSGNRFQGMGPAFYPGLLAALLGLLSLGLGIRGLFVPEEAAPDGIEEKTGKAFPLFGSHLKTPGVLILIVCVYLIGMNILGFLVTTPLFLVATMKSLRSEWKSALFVGLFLSALVYAIFGIVLRVPLPEGYLVGG